MTRRLPAGTLVGARRTIGCDTLGTDDLELRDSLRAFGLGDEDLEAWRAGGLAGGEFDGWLADRVARRPSGSRAGQLLVGRR